MDIQKRSQDLSERLRQLYKDLALEITITTQRPEGWLPRTVFVESDQYEDGFMQCKVTEIHPDGTFTAENLSTGETETHDLTEINIDWLALMLDLYASDCHEQGLKETQEVRRCDSCGRPMKEGYYLAGEYACSDECALNLYHGDKATMEEDLSHADEDDGECYYTEWDSYYFEV